MEGWKAHAQRSRGEFPQGSLSCRGAACGSVLFLNTFKLSSNRCIPFIGAMGFPHPAAFPESLESTRVLSVQQHSSLVPPG